MLAFGIVLILLAADREALQCGMDRTVGARGDLSLHHEQDESRAQVTLLA